MTLCWMTDGRLDNPLSPERVSVEEIAKVLSKLCRFGGHTKYFYSVAEHCWQVCKLLESKGCSPKVQLAGLLHDAAEAYLCDVQTPIKRHVRILGYDYSEYESKILKKIFKSEGLPPLYDTPEVKLADQAMLAVEAFDYVIGGGRRDAREGLLPCDAERVFMDEYRRLRNEIG